MRSVRAASTKAARFSSLAAFNQLSTAHNPSGSQVKRASGG